MPVWRTNGQRNINNEERTKKFLSSVVMIGVLKHGAYEPHTKPINKTTTTTRNKPNDLNIFQTKTKYFVENNRKTKAKKRRPRIKKIASNHDECADRLVSRGEYRPNTTLLDEEPKIDDFRTRSDRNNLLNWSVWHWHWPIAPHSNLFLSISRV